MNNKRAIFLLNSTHLTVYRDIAEVLKREHGWDIYGFSHQRISNHLKSVCTGYLDLSTVVERAKDSPVPADIIEKCRRLELDYGLNLADIISTDRHLGIGWVTGGLYHRGRLSRMPYERHLHIIHEVFMAFREFLEGVEPDFVCPGVVGSFQGAIVYALCHQNKIPVYGLSNVGYGNNHYWQRDRSGAIPNLEDAYQELKSSATRPYDTDITDTEIKDIASYTRSVFPEIVAKAGFSNMLGKLLETIYRHIRYEMRGTKKAGEVYLSQSLRYIVANYLNSRKELRRKYQPFHQLAKTDYVYFPLHYEPEASLNAIEPYFTNQMYAVELLSKSVPTGVDVLVKEHPKGNGNRPSHWMDTIAGFPRVVLVHPLQNSIELIRNSMATATITGTAGLEAAMLGVPVISMGSFYRFNFVDHVWLANDIPSLRKLIRWIYENKDSHDFKENGAILKKTIETTCFETEGEPVIKPPSSSDVELACDKLLELLYYELPLYPRPEGDIERVSHRA